MKIQVKGGPNVSLELLRPTKKANWQPVVSGDWAEDRYHSGHIAYYIANTGSGQWVLDGVERNALLDDVTQEDVDEGRLNDDQLQALLGVTLEEAQSAVYREIRAACSGAPEDLTAQEIAAILYRAACESGSPGITAPDEHEHLIDPW